MNPIFPNVDHQLVDLVHFLILAIDHRPELGA